MRITILPSHIPPSTCRIILSSSTIYGNFHHFEFVRMNKKKKETYLEFGTDIEYHEVTGTQLVYVVSFMIYYPLEH